jgi:hypothetical protein
MPIVVIASSRSSSRSKNSPLTLLGSAPVNLHQLDPTPPHAVVVTVVAESNPRRWLGRAPPWWRLRLTAGWSRRSHVSGLRARAGAVCPCQLGCDLAWPHRAVATLALSRRGRTSEPGPRGHVAGPRPQGTRLGTPVNSPDLLLLRLSLFSRSVIGFVSPSPIVSRLACPRHGLQQHWLLHLLRWCNWRGMRRNRNACLCRTSSCARPSMSARRHHHRSRSSTIDITIVISDSHDVGLINRSWANHPPETFVVHHTMLRQARGSSLHRLLGQQHRRLSSTNVVASTSLSTSSVRVSRARFEQAVRHMRAAPAHPLFCAAGPPACCVNTLHWCCGCPRCASHRRRFAPHFSSSSLPKNTAIALHWCH